MLWTPEVQLITLLKITDCLVPTRIMRTMAKSPRRHFRTPRDSVRLTMLLIPFKVFILTADDTLPQVGKTHKPCQDPQSNNWSLLSAQVFPRGGGQGAWKKRQRCQLVLSPSFWAGIHSRASALKSPAGCTASRSPGKWVLANEPAILGASRGMTWRTSLVASENASRDSAAASPVPHLEVAVPESALSGKSHSFTGHRQNI